MSEKPISPLRRRMIEDMSVRHFGEKTKTDYIRHVETFAAFLGRSPVTATADNLRRYPIHVLPKGAASHPALRPPRQQRPRRECRQDARAARGRGACV